MEEKGPTTCHQSANLPSRRNVPVMRIIRTVQFCQLTPWAGSQAAGCAGSNCPLRALAAASRSLTHKDAVDRWSTDAWVKIGATPVLAVSAGLIDPGNRIPEQLGPHARQ
ncbi:hypothetical protein BaRGS_00013811 [Batillaria attramentaria]|uniref:Uncharacterized protein n=1 Tax=Batillaria attramentaria TaxID=370345 RepID=A0ABD0L6E7_9CAEN